MGFYSKRHYERLHPTKDTPGAIQERIRARLTGEQANREMMEKFAPLTPENAGKAIAWQDARIKELMQR